MGAAHFLSMQETVAAWQRYDAAHRASQMRECVQVLNSLHLAPFPRPLASLVEDYPPEQGHKGWLVRALAGHS